MRHATWKADVDGLITFLETVVSPHLPLDAAPPERLAPTGKTSTDAARQAPTGQTPGAPGEGDVGALSPAAGRPADPPLDSEPVPRDLASWSLDDLTIEAFELFWTERWAEAIPILAEITSRRPDDQDAAQKLEAARRHVRLAALYARGSEVFAAQAWAEAVESLEALVAEDATYRDAATLLADARRQKELTDLLAEARRLHRDGQWQAAIAELERLQAVDASYADAEVLLASARDALAVEVRNQQLTALYGRAISEMNAGAWPRAVEILEDVNRRSPGYRSTEPLLARAQGELARAREAERQQRLADLYDDARRAHDAGSWAEATEHLQTIVALDPAYRDAASRLVTVRRLSQAELLHVLDQRILAFRQAQEAERQQRLADLYAAGLRAYATGDWAEAATRLQAVVSQAPGYRDAMARLLDVEYQAKADLLQTLD